MPPERRPPDDPREWLNRARSNLIRSRAMLDGVYLEDLCFDAQHAVEKALEAVLIARGVDYPFGFRSPSSRGNLTHIWAV